MSRSPLICHIHKTLRTVWGPQPLQLTFELEAGRILGVYGPSGVGKTTLLRILAGLTDIEEGSIRNGDDIWQDTTKGVKIPAKKRSVGMVFQDFALFPHMTVRENLAFALPKGEKTNEINRLIELLELQSFQHVRPAKLSGGQQQRVALGRAMVRRPGLLLLDEPLSALDEPLRYRLQDQFLRAHREYAPTTLLVSHNREELFRLADEVICLEAGRIVRRGSPAAVLSGAPASSAVSPVSHGTTLRLTGIIVAINPGPGDGIGIHDGTRAKAIHVLCGSNLLQINVTSELAARFAKGQRIIVTSPSFKPEISPLE